MTNLLILAVLFALIQTVNVALFFKNGIGYGAVAWCWFIVILVAVLRIKKARRGQTYELKVGRRNSP